MGNAIKFTHQGSVTVKASFLPTNEKMGRLEITVEDTGIGIPQPQQEAIFAAFTQQAGQSNRQYGGTGLGLTISKRLVERMKGTISVESKVGQGSVFTVILPEVEVKKQSSLQTQATENAPNLSFEYANILVVDDFRSNIEAVESLLGSAGITVTAAENGERALEILKYLHPDLILLDMRMPDIDGYEVARKIKSNPEKKHIPIIAFTASVFSSSKIEETSDFDGFLYKPVSRAALFRELSKFLKHSVIPSNEISSISNKGGIAISPEVRSKISEILATLEEQFLFRWEEIKDSFVLFKIELFANDLLALAKKHNFDYLIQYATTLKRNIELIDLELIKDKLDEFPTIITNIQESTKNQ